MFLDLFPNYSHFLKNLFIKKTILRIRHFFHIEDIFFILTKNSIELMVRLENWAWWLRNVKILYATNINNQKSSHLVSWKISEYHWFLFELSLKNVLKSLCPPYQCSFSLCTQCSFFLCTKSSFSLCTQCSFSLGTQYSFFLSRISNLI